MRPAKALKPRRAPPVASDQVSARAVPRLLLSEVDLIANKVSDELDGRRINEKQKYQLLHAINEALYQYSFEASYEEGLTPKQFRKKFEAMRASLRRLKKTLPLPRPNDRLFETVCRHGEAHAEKHGPHPGLDPSELPPLSLPGLEWMSDDDETSVPKDWLAELPPQTVPGLDVSEVKFHSSGRLRGLIMAVEQVEKWMSKYDETLVPKIGWASLEAKLGGKTRTARVRLIGRTLPAIYTNFFGSLPRSGSSSNRTTGKRTYRPWVHFVCEVCQAANVPSVSPEAIEQNWKRMRAKKDPFEMDSEFPVGDLKRFAPVYVKHRRRDDKRD